VAEAGWADERPNDHDRPGLSRVRPCANCQHDEHPFLRCGAVLVADHSAVCPCRCPVPGIYA